jgi:hypothetical protein
MATVRIHDNSATIGTLHGSEGVFSYLVPANSPTVVRVAR